MYFKFYPMESESLAIVKTESIGIVKDSDDSYMLVRTDDENLCRIIDASIGHFAGMVCEDLDTVLNRDRSLFRHYGVRPVENEMMDEDAIWYYACLKWYETREAANAEVEKIAEAISRGDKLYDLTEDCHNAP